jgi:hypothetical protein
MSMFKRISDNDDRRNEGMDKFAKNWMLYVGLLVFSSTMILKHTVGINDMLMGFGDGLGIAFIFLGMLAAAGKPICRLKKRIGNSPEGNA